MTWNNKKLVEFLQGTEWKLSLWNLLFSQSGLFAGISALSGFLAYWSKVLADYSPFSYFLIAILTYFVLAIAARLFAAAKWISQSAALRDRLVNTYNINPLEDIFKGTRLKASELLPIVGHKVVGKTFINCDLVGPLNAAFRTCRFTNNKADMADAVLITAGVVPNNGVLFENCVFDRCNFYYWTFNIHQEFIDEFISYGWNNLNVLNRPLNPAPPIKIIEPKKKKPAGKHTKNKI